MVSFEEFQDMIEEIVQTFPEEFFRELNGGVFARTNIRNTTRKALAMSFLSWANTAGSTILGALL